MAPCEAYRDSLVRGLEGDFSQCCDRTKENGLNLKEERSGLDTTKKFFTMKTVRH